MISSLEQIQLQLYSFGARLQELLLRHDWTLQERQGNGVRFHEWGCWR